MIHSSLQRFGLAVAVFGLMALSAEQAHATSVSGATLTSAGSFYPGDPYTLGFEFTVNHAITVTDLGVYNNNPTAGLAAPSQVGIWTLAGTLLASTTVPAGTGGTLVNGFRYSSIAPLALTTGVHYIVGAYLKDTATSFNTSQNGSGFYDPAINGILDRFSATSSFSAPLTTDGFAGGAWLGGNFLFTGAASVPEPSTIVSLAIAGLMGVGVTVRRRKATA